MQQYLSLLEEVFNNGKEKGDRTGTGTKSIFGKQMRFDLQLGFPLLTTKKVFFRGIVCELLWFLSGSRNIKSLQESNVHIWDKWALDNGDLGPIYGYQWRNWPARDGNGIDQISALIHNIKTNPNSRRHIVSAWNVEYLPDESISPHDNVNQGKMALAACHVMFQMYVSEEKLSCMLIARSQDLFLGTPFNIASYALLTHMIAQQTNLNVGELVWVGGDVHIYNNHVEQVQEQLSRSPKELPSLKIIRKPDSILDYVLEDFVIEGYNSYPSIKAPISV